MNLGATARQLRESFGLTQRAAANHLDISCVHLCNIENDKSRPSPELMAKFREVFGVDIYVYSWCLHPNMNELPSQLRAPTQKLANIWEKLIEQRRRAFRKDA